MIFIDMTHMSAFGLFSLFVLELSRANVATAAFKNNKMHPRSQEANFDLFLKAKS